MYKRVIRFFDLFAILTVLVAQLGVSPVAAAATQAPTRTAVPSTPTFVGTTLSNVSINGGGNTAGLAPGSSFNLSLDYSIVDADCPNCIDQIEIGYADASGPYTCVYNGIPGRAGAAGSASIEVTAPGTPGIYYIVFDRSQHYSCGQALESGWWNGAPGPDRYVAQIITATQVVNSAADTDDGTCDAENCTLREAINDANASEGSDYIVFDIPGEGPRTISPLTLLPAIAGPTVIDGYSQAGAAPNSLAVGVLIKRLNYLQNPKGSKKNKIDFHFIYFQKNKNNA